MMSNNKLSLEIITPQGDVFKKNHVEEIVFHRKEKRYEPGSEIAILPLHGPSLIKIAIAPVRYRINEQTHYLALAGGFAEVKGEHVLVITPRFELIDPDQPNPHDRAQKITHAWYEESKHGHLAMIGYSS